MISVRMQAASAGVRGRSRLLNSFELSAQLCKAGKVKICLHGTHSKAGRRLKQGLQ